MSELDTQFRLAGIAQLVERILGKDEVTGSNPVSGSCYGVVAELVNAPPCHGGDCGFESRPRRFYLS